MNSSNTRGNMSAEAPKTARDQRAATSDARDDFRRRADIFNTSRLTRGLSGQSRTKSVDIRKHRIRRPVSRQAREAAEDVFTQFPSRSFLVQLRKLIYE